MSRSYHKYSNHVFMAIDMDSINSSNNKIMQKRIFRHKWNRGTYDDFFSNNFATKAANKLQHRECSWL